MTSPETRRRPGRVERILSPFRQRRPRLIAYAIAAAILAILVVFPLRFEARTQLLPEEANSSVASAINFGAGLQNFASTIGTHQTTEVYLLLARSNDVALEVIRRLHLLGKPGFGNIAEARLTLARKLDVHSLSGGVLEIQTKDSDPNFAKSLVATYSEVLQDRAAALSRAQTAKKKAIVAERFKDTVTNLARAQATLDAFRRQNNLAQPQSQFGVAVGLKASLQGELQGKLVQLRAAQQFETGNNLEIQQIQAQIDSLRSQIAQADTTSAAAPSSLTGLASKADQYYNLYREEQYQEGLEQAYERAMEQVIIEEISAEENNNVEVIEDPYVLPGLQVSVPAIALLLLVGLVALYTEIYAPMTGLYRRR